MRVDHRDNQRQARRERGQSMVEFALTLPILLLIVAGTLEVANLLLMYNRLQLAAREAARFAAQGGTDTGVVSIVQNASTETLEMVPGTMEVWIVRPIVEVNPSWGWNTSADGTGGVNPNAWTPPGEVCVYPSAAEGGCENADSGVSPATVIARLQTITSGNLAQLDGERLAVVMIYYEAPTILNLSFTPVPGLSNGRLPMRVYSLFRQEIVQQTVNQLSSGCSAYPIAVNQTFTNAAGHTLTQATEGETFPGVPRGATGFEWLMWRSGGSSTQTSLTYPGNSLDAALGYQDPGDPGDTTLHRGDPVLVSTNLGTVQTPLNDHISTGRTLRIILFNSDNGTQVTISGFVVVRIMGSSTQDVLNLKFVRVDSSCGFE